MSKSLKKYSGIVMISSGGILVLSVVCFIVMNMMLSSMADKLGFNLSGAALQRSLREAEAMASMLGYSLAESLGVSNFQIILTKVSMAMRFPLLILGILGLRAGLAMYFMDPDSPAVEAARKTIADGVSSASFMIKDTIDKATVKCPKCGKVSSAKTAFCSGCGEKLPQPVPTPRPEKVSHVSVKCPGCGKVYKEKIAFCSECGHKLPEPLPEKIACPSCGTENKGGAKFCFACGTKLVTGETKTSSAVSGETVLKTPVTPADEAEPETAPAKKAGATSFESIVLIAPQPVYKEPVAEAPAEKVAVEESDVPGQKADSAAAEAPALTEANQFMNRAREL